MTEIEYLKARLREHEARFDAGDFEEVDSARGPGWGHHYCPICGEYGWEGTESVTEDAMYEHLDERHDRAYQLALIDAQRRIIVDAEEAERRFVERGYKQISLVLPHRGVIHWLLQPYADRDDFRGEWKA